MPAPDPLDVNDAVVVEDRDDGALPDITKTNQDELLPAWARHLLGLYLVVLGAFIAYLTVVIWPPDFDVARERVHAPDRAKDVVSPIVLFRQQASPTPSTSPATSPVNRATSTPTLGPSPVLNPSTLTTDRIYTVTQIAVSYDRRLLLLVMVVSALGSFIHVASSFGDFVGNRRLTRSWVWWYLLRPYVGVPLATLFYFVVRAGFLTSGGSAGDVNRFGIAAIAGLVGMFSVKAADKLKELFDTLFKTTQQRKDTLANPLPIVQGLRPSKYITGGEFVDVVVTGSGFIPPSTVKVGKTGRETEYRSATELSVKLLAQDIAKAGSVQLSVTNPPPGGGISEPAVLVLEHAPPAVTNVDYNNNVLQITGSGFIADSTILINGKPRPQAKITSVTPTKLTIALTPQGNEAGAVDIQVVNPPPGGGTSGKRTLTL
jgi:hypothetical protein